MMITPSDWVPMRWSGRWNDRLGKLDNTPINCLVIKQGEPPPSRAGTTILKESELGAVTLVSDARWPQVQAMKGRAADAGPTGLPWVDANGWLVRLTQFLEPARPVWLPVRVPENSTPAAIQVAVADAASCGGRWLVDFGETFPGDEHWNKAVEALAFFEKHKDWRDFSPGGVLGAMSDFKGENELLSHEFLNLAARRQLACRILDKSKLVPLEGLRAVVYIDTMPPRDKVLEHLAAWVRQGGLLISPPGLKPGKAVPGDNPGYEMCPVGKGRIAVAKSDWTDPWVLVSETHLMLSYRYDVVRLWNAGSLSSYYSESKDKRRALVQLVNYSSRFGSNDLSLAVAGQWRAARFHTFQGVTDLKPLPAFESVELDLPPLGPYAAIELER